MLLRIGYGISSFTKVIAELLSGFYKINSIDSLLINSAGDKLIIKYSS